MREAAINDDSVLRKMVQTDSQWIQLPNKRTNQYAKLSASDRLASLSTLTTGLFSFRSFHTCIHSRRLIPSCIQHSVSVMVME